MKKKCKIRLLPTEDNTRIVMHASGLDHYHENLQTAHKAVNFIGGTYQHMYILSDDEIQDGDWVLLTSAVMKAESIFKEYGEYIGKKIIATTDKSLWKRVPHPEGSVKGDLPSIPQQFIEEYCKNPVDEIEVEYHCKTCSMTTGRHKMSCKDSYTREYVPKLNNNEIIIHPVKEKMYTREELITFAKKYGKAIIQFTGVDNDGESCYCTLDRDKWIQENL